MNVSEYGLSLEAFKDSYSSPLTIQLSEALTSEEFFTRCL